MASSSQGVQGILEAAKQKEKDNKSSDFDHLVSLWAKRVIRYSSQYNNTTWAADATVGAPRVYPQYGDIHGAWAQSNIDAHQFIELEYEEKLYIEQVDIYETYHAGAVTCLKALSPSGDWITLWSTGQAQHINQSRIFTPPLDMVSFKSDALRLELDCTRSQSWCEIDAVKLVGKRHLVEPPPAMAALSDDLKQLVNSQEFSDVAFKVESFKVYGHKAILAARSHYFRAMFCDGLKESHAGPQQLIPIKDMSYEGFLGMMQYLYTNTLDSSITPLKFVELIRVADRFSLDGMRKMSHFTLCEQINVENVVEIFTEATVKLPQLEDVRQTCLEFISQHMDKVSKTTAFCSLSQPLMLEVVQEATGRLRLK